MNPVEINRPASITNEKGTTIEWCKGNPGQQVTAYYRSKGTFFAQHYHKGDDPSKSPELFLLLKGKIEFTYIHPETREKIVCILDAGNQVTVQPLVKHQAKALEDCIFIEYRASVFDPNNPDTYPVDPSEFI